MKKIKYILLFVIIGFVFLIKCGLSKYDNGEEHYYLNGIDFDVYKSDSVIFRNTTHNEMISKIHSINKTENHYFVLDFSFGLIGKETYWLSRINSLENKKIDKISLHIKNGDKIIDISKYLSPYTLFDTLVYCGDSQLNVGHDFKTLTYFYNNMSDGDGDFHSVNYLDIAIPIEFKNIDLENKTELILNVMLEGKTFSKSKFYTK